MKFKLKWLVSEEKMSENFDGHLTPFIFYLLSLDLRGLGGEFRNLL